MKKNLFMLLVAAAGVFNVACDSKDDTTPPITTPSADVTFAPTHVIGGYSPKFLNGTTDAFALTLGNVAVSGDANNPKIAGEGQVLILEMYNRMTETGVLPKTTYKIVPAESVREKTCSSNSALFTTDASGTLVSGFVLKSGTVEVTREDKVYTIKVNAKMGYSDNNTGDQTLYASYTGEIEFPQMPFSPLTSDRVADLKDLPSGFLYTAATGDAIADKWNVNIYSAADGTEGVQIVLEFPIGETSLSTSIPDGTYKVGTYTVGGDPVCIPGTMVFGEGSSLFGTWYIGKFDTQLVVEQSPATGGSMTIARTATEGEYTVSFDFLDDRSTPNHITGSWTGIPELATPKASAPKFAAAASASALATGSSFLNSAR